MIKKIASGLLAGLLLSGCGGTGSTKVTQHVVHSTPAFCIPILDGSALRVCPNTSDVNDYVIRTQNECSGAGIEGEWGTTFLVTTTTKTLIGVADSCGFDVIDVNIESTVEDPIGTRYTNELGSNAGGLKIKRIAGESDWYSLQGYSGEELFCEPSLCGDLFTEEFKIFPSTLEFELVSIDGQRRIQIVSSAP